MALQAIPKDACAPWRRKTVPERYHLAALLLVDLSASMSGAKAEAALAAAVLLTEVLDRLGVTFAVYGFQDQLILLRDFGTRPGTVPEKAIGDIPLETQGIREGGHNHPYNNDDGPCLQEAAKKLLAVPATDRLLIVVSDGEPAGCRSDEKDGEGNVVYPLAALGDEGQLPSHHAILSSRPPRGPSFSEETPLTEHPEPRRTPAPRSARRSHHRKAYAVDHAQVSAVGGQRGGHSLPVLLLGDPADCDHRQHVLVEDP